MASCCFHGYKWFAVALAGARHHVRRKEVADGKAPHSTASARSPLEAMVHVTLMAITLAPDFAAYNARRCTEHDGKIVLHVGSTCAV